MTCNCCLSTKVLDHDCVENCLKTTCPVCSEFMFTSSTSVRILPCGHCIHAACFKVCIPYYLLMITSLLRFNSCCSFRLDLSQILPSTNLDQQFVDRVPNSYPILIIYSLPFLTGLQDSQPHEHLPKLYRTFWRWGGKYWNISFILFEAFWVAYILKRDSALAIKI